MSTTPSSCAGGASAPSSAGRVPPELAGLVDDAATFPPAALALDDALAGYRRHRRQPYADLVGPMVVADTDLASLVSLAATGADGPAGPLPVTVVVSGGAGGVEPVVRWCDSPALELRSVEVALRDPQALADNARRVMTAASSAGCPAPVYVEPPPPDQDPTGGWLAALDEVAAADGRLKLRTGGATADLFPTSAQVAAFLDAALDRELPFKCTAGLHRAVRHRAEDTGFEHHGFLNVLLATRAALDGEDVVAVLEEHDPAAVVARVREVGPDAVARTRRWFASFGCCDVRDPWSGLVSLGLVTA